LAWLPAKAAPARMVVAASVAADALKMECIVSSLDAFL
jgi:hypothetical protein